MQARSLWPFLFWIYAALRVVALLAAGAYYAGIDVDQSLLLMVLVLYVIQEKFLSGVVGMVVFLCVLGMAQGGRGVLLPALEQLSPRVVTAHWVLWTVELAMFSAFGLWALLGGLLWMVVLASMFGVMEKAN